MTFRGLTWDHPRGFDALAAASHLVNAGKQEELIVWDTQPLEGFESAPIADLAANYDLIVLDHPHIGEAVQKKCFIPIEELFSHDQIARWETQSVGPALSSYNWEGQTYALPLDVATQTMARNEKLLPNAPAYWPEILELARTLPVAQSLAGPHAFLTLISMVGGHGHWPKGDALLPTDPACEALRTMAELYAHRPEGSETLNPISMLETMSRDETIALVPLIFGYVTYANAELPNPLRFSNSLRKMNGAGGVLGGTGIGFSRRCKPTPELLEHIAWLMLPDTQTDFIPSHGGQPSARAAWQSPSVNAPWNSFYEQTLATAERALLRPRFAGYIEFQTAAGEVIRDALACNIDPLKTLNCLRALWRNARASANGNLDDDRGPSS